jgi:hypothetical protein
MFRRFLILGLPKILRAMAPNADIQIYVGLVVMAVSPVVYSQVDPVSARTIFVNSANLLFLLSCSSLNAPVPRPR